MDIYNNLDDLAALISSCDEIVSIANINANMGGALNKKSNILIDESSRWRFGITEKKCDWFESIKLFRKNESRCWDTALNEIKDELNR